MNLSMFGHFPRLEVLGTSIGSMPNASFWVLSDAPKRFVDW